MMKIDLLDKKIIYLLCQNSRFTDTDISKSLKTSRQVISNRIEKLVNNKIIHGFETEINYLALGFNEAIILFKSHKPKPLIQYLVNSPQHIYISENYSRWNILSYCIFRSINDLFQETQKIIDKHEIADILIIFKEDRYKYYPLFRKYFQGINKISIPKSNYSFQKVFSKKKEETSIKKEDYEILKELAENSRVSLNKIANNIKKSVPTVKKRIIELIKGGIIENFVPSIDQTKLGYQTHYLFIKLQKQKSKEIDAIVKMIYELENIAYVMKSQNQFDLIIDFYTNSHQDIENISQKILQPIQHIIQEFELIWAIKEHKFIRTVID